MGTAGFNLDGFDIKINENSGDLEVVKTEQPQQQQQQSQQQNAESTQIDQNQQQQLQTPDMLFSGLQNQISSLTELVNRQSKALGLLLQANIENQQNQPVESLGEDNDKLVDTIVGKLTPQINNLQQQVAPLIQNQQIERETAAEYQAFFARTPDAVNYEMGMHQILNAMPNKNWTFQELYVIAKGMNLKNPVQTQPQLNNTQNQQNNNQQQQSQNQQQFQQYSQGDNVVPINQNNKRELPARTNTQNSQLQSKEIRPGREGLRDAMEAAMEELGYGT